MPPMNEVEAVPAINTTLTERVVYQPIHPSIRPLLDPEYVTFHDRYVQYVRPEQLEPWSPHVRTRFTWPYSGSPLTPVGKVQDIRIDSDFTIRAFSPATSTTTSRRPVVIWLHGGGFVGGNIDSDNDLCSLICKKADCVVLNVDYRLAPEHPYPAAIDDVMETLKWVSSDRGVQELGIDRTKIVIGGASAGGNLATVGALLAAQLSIPIMLQVLVVPVTDNTATLETLWSSYPHAPGLTAPRMTWFRDLYISNPPQQRDWQLSPLYAPTELLSQLPKTWIAIAGQDMLSTEGLAYGELLRKAGVQTDMRVYDGMPHAMMALSGVLKQGRQCLEDVVEIIRGTLQAN
ncbi:hypothetical protein LTS08_004646 [Lithohypha guttulata]|uniref:Alpha/beta hydrolase fold-3 domain-containing protein n=1 Tax=Lithohypha guttulata TaxID=1690604 RepID=A0AAN7T2I7_9EURO|nr:hypothetical protein LTR51_006093 [Lithohypha guttulata]KAK5088296.1 hypothetical protein LTR05_002513 [Lithohypha guttulata]KAK5101040.1 hypothetical protein LTS08_004646 [Lithohypha guttulata]